MLFIDYFEGSNLMRIVDYPESDSPGFARWATPPERRIIASFFAAARKNAAAAGSAQVKHPPCLPLKQALAHKSATGTSPALRKATRVLESAGVLKTGWFKDKEKHASDARKQVALLAAWRRGRPGSIRTRRTYDLHGQLVRAEIFGP